MVKVLKAPVAFDEPLTTHQAAARLGVDVGVIWDLLLSGQLRGGPDRSRRIWIDGEHLRELVAAGFVATGNS